MFLKNAWYMAAWSTEIGAEPRQRWIIDQPVVLYRTSAGVVAALDDRCPHRFAPLSKGRLVGDDIVCIYHGAKFNPQGVCLVAPSRPNLGPDCNVTSYPVEEKWGCIFIWMGDKELADPASIPDVRQLDTPGWRPIRGYLPCNANYQLCIDNLLDLSHETHLHPGTIGSAEIAETPAKVSVRENVVTLERVMHDISPPPLFANAKGITSNIDRFQKISVTLPTFAAADIKAIALNNLEDPDPLRFFVYFFMTPNRKDSTHYFFSLTRNFAVDSDEVDEVLMTGTQKTIAEDIDMLEAQQEMVSDRELSTRTLFTRLDVAPDRARATLSKLIRQEDRLEARLSP